MAARLASSHFTKDAAIFWSYKMSNLKKLREDRNAAVTAMKEMVARADAESRGFTVDDDSAWAKAEADISSIDKRISAEERIAQFGSSSPILSDAPAVKADGNALFRKYLRNGLEGMAVEERNAVRELRAFSAGTGNTGGFSVPEDFYNVLENALKAMGAMWQTSEIIRTAGGATLPMPTFNYTGISATIVSENAAGTLDSSTPFGVANLAAYTYRSPILPVSLEFLDDTAFDESFITNALAESIVRGTNAHFTTGTGTSQPQGIVTGSVLGKTGTTGQTATVIYDDLVDLVHSIDPAYRTSFNSSNVPANEALFGVGQKVGFMMRDASVAVVRKLKDSQLMPIWSPSYQNGQAGGAPDTLLGFPVYVNNDVPAMAANAKSILFGRLDKYKVRVVQDVRMLRLTERYADNLQVGFVAFLRCDGRLLDAGTNPVKHYANSAT
ncbi:COG4653 Predicted phage phi-C31 gp36 major capsid-like protein [uncultured Caudovirales phage]|uniref:COG4653 Predicted phage phi-C31 gp36 major capsid-like protein n=1 Tax=uncultured Caudovirales phage TaxID=2100421 RepID=A0A6J5N551_9CAUD|nr:COG4653 Predicted phage phi-C31 gp36 major capsid-like protein [uncultured Caudovirales phage]